MSDFEKHANEFFKVTMNPGDYLDAEGYIVCGTCKERRQRKHEAQGMIPRNCACRRKENERIESETKAQQHRQTVETILHRGRIDGGLRSMTFETLDDQNAKVTEVCRSYADRWGIALAECHGILLYGNPGTGKTHHAYAIANAIAEKEHTVFCINVAEFVNNGRGDSQKLENILRSVKTVDLLVLDDFGATRNTEYPWEQLYGLINARYNAHKPTIITTNLAPDALEASTDPWMVRIYSRIVEMCQIPLKLVGEDRRKEKAAAARAECRKLYT